MNTQQLNRIEEIARRFDEFNNTKMINESNINVFRSMEFGMLATTAETLGFNVLLSTSVVMNLTYEDNKQVLITVDCDDEFAYIETSKLWEFIEQNRDPVLMH